MKYDVLIDTDKEQLAEQVNCVIAQGWEPFGGVSVSMVRYEYKTRDGYEEEEYKFMYAQAVVRGDEAQKAAV